MKAITLTQPWATLVAIGEKRIETRSWSTSYRGALAIHAAKGFPKVARQISLQSPFIEALNRAGYLPDLPFGCVVATCRLVDCRLIVDSHFALTVSVDSRMLPPLGLERKFGDYSPGRYAWILEDVKPLLEPIPAKGALGLWVWDQRPERWRE